MTETPTIAMWVVNGPTQRERIDICGKIQVHADGSLDDGRGDEESAIEIQPVTPTDGFVAVAFVKRTVGRSAALNGTPVSCGLRPLRHADRLDVGARQLWISAESATQRTRFVPAEHGTDVRCGLTKARLHEGQEIVICPGVPGTQCGVIYEAQAWDAVIQANPQMKCPNCGYRPTAVTWQPPVPQQHREVRFDELSRLAGRS